MPVPAARLVTLPLALVLAASALEAQDSSSAATPADSAYQAFQVEQPAEAAPGGCFPKIPRKVRGNPVYGEVHVEFVLDARGRPEPASIKVLRATHPEYEAAVRKAIPCMRFRPAMLGGRAVRQLVQQPFAFHLPGNAGRE